MSHMEEREREHLEQRWKDLNRDAIRDGNGSLASRIRQGERLVLEYNQDCTELHHHLNLMIMIEGGVARINYFLHGN